MSILRVAIVCLLCCYVSCKFHSAEDKKESWSQTITQLLQALVDGYCQSEVQNYEPPTLCGISDPGMCGYQYSGNHEELFAGFGDYPWMVAILKDVDGETTWRRAYIGGGSIIHPSVVLTTAHKFEKPEPIKCRAGEWDTRTRHELLPYQDRSVKKIVKHDEFDKNNAYNDIALLFLSTPFILAPHVGVACLGTRMPMPGTECYSMGWGGDLRLHVENFPILKKIPLILVENKKCENIFKKVLEDPTFFLHNSLTCADSKKELDTCAGDGGSPLVCSVLDPFGESRRYAIYGLVAYGIGCGEGIPGVYVKIPQMYQWVKDQMVAAKISDSNFDI